MESNVVYSDWTEILAIEFFVGLELLNEFIARRKSWSSNGYVTHVWVSKLYL